MTNDEDERIAALFRKDAPPERDPLFRLKVLERRERQAFRRRMLVLALVAVGIAGAGVLGALSTGRAFDIVRVLFFGVALSGGYFVLGPQLARYARRLIS